MSVTEYPLQLPDYDVFSQMIAVLDLSISSSELHGMLSGYLAAGKGGGEFYIRSLIAKNNTMMTREIMLSLFHLQAITQQQLSHAGFEFQLLLPNDAQDLVVRAQAFSEWCHGFFQGMNLAGVKERDLFDEETQEALQHITEFAELDYQSIEVSAEDEYSLVEVCEYTRVAVMHIYNDLNINPKSETTH
jgi:uncharacterized protein YgfB (UPF0149 family)